MGILEICFIGIGLAMDAFAVAVCKGLSMKKLEIKKAVIIALYFGIFQALMPAMGYFLGVTFKDFVVNVDHWLAFSLLAFIGGSMIKESFEDDSDNINDNIEFKTMSVLALATSIDALAVGITFAFLKANIILSVFIIGLITFIISMMGVKIGNKFGSKYGSKAELLGGIILILMGLKILIEHLGIL